MRRRFGAIVALVLFAAVAGARLAGQRGQASYAVAVCRVNGVRVSATQIPPEHLSIFSDRTYKWIDPNDDTSDWQNNSAHGKFTYDPKTEKFNFISGVLTRWGPAKLDDDSLSIYVGYRDGRHQLWEMRLDRIPDSTICPIWPLCT
jgi:hypothetical protein